VFHLARRPTCHLLWRKAPRCDQPDFGPGLPSLN
jgi:hypothetical protein